MNRIDIKDELTKIFESDEDNEITDETLNSLIDYIEDNYKLKDVI